MEELIKKEKVQLERTKSKFPVIHASRLKQLMDESGLSSKMDKAQTEQVQCCVSCMVAQHPPGILPMAVAMSIELTDIYLHHKNVYTGLHNVVSCFLEVSV